MARGFTAKQTGASSRFGGAAGANVRRVLNPWGNMVPAAKGRRANAVGATIAKSRASRRSAVAMPKADASRWSMDYPKNDPLQWPIQAGKRGSPSGMTQHKADVNNAAVNHAYQRAGYAG